MRVTPLAVLALGWCLAGCNPLHILGDEGEWLGERLGSAAERLRRSNDTVLVVRYSPDKGVNQHYSVGVGQSVWCPRPPCLENKGALTVSVERGRHGSTTYHMRFVAVPNSLRIEKSGEPTQLVLRKKGDVIELVELR